MILGIGTDLCDVRRIETVLDRHGDRFLRRVFAVAEHEQGRQRGAGQGAFFAKRFAAKEACAKALGTGFQQGVFLHDIVVENDDLGRPAIRLQGGAADRLRHLTPPGRRAEIHLSLSDEPPMVLAFVVIALAADA